MIQLTLTLKMTTTQAVEMSITVNNSRTESYSGPRSPWRPCFTQYMNDSWIQDFHSKTLRLRSWNVHPNSNVSISSKVNVLQIYNIPIKLPLFSGKPHCFPPPSVIWRFLSGDRRLFPSEVSGSSARIGTLRPAEIPPQAERVSMREGKFKHRVYRIWPNYHCASFKGIRIPESGDVFPVESGIQIKECGI